MGFFSRLTDRLLVVCSTYSGNYFVDIQDGVHFRKYMVSELLNFQAKWPGAKKSYSHTHLIAVNLYEIS